MLVRTKNVSKEQKNLRPNTKIFGKKIRNLCNNFRMKKISAEQKNFRRKIFSFRKYLRLFGKNKNLRNEDSKSLFVTKTIVCQFHEKNVCVFPNAIVRGLGTVKIGMKPS